MSLHQSLLRPSTKMVSGAAGLRAAADVVVLAMLVLSSQGHPTKKPLCSDCPSLCSTNCSAFIDAASNGTCSPPIEPCNSCKSQVLRGCCQDFCSSGNETNSISSCCPSDCISGDFATCSCDNCKTKVEQTCGWAACGMHASDRMRCDNCKMGAAQACFPSCNSACNDNCVKKKHC
ncbi:hypothetical protein EJB05_06091, partial [Eragrostis curvula]